MSTIDPALIAEWTARAAAPGSDGWRKAVEALLAERTEALALLDEARWLVAESTYLAAGVSEDVHTRAVHLADRLAGFLDAPPPTPAELDAALRAQAARA